MCVNVYKQWMLQEGFENRDLVDCQVFQGARPQWSTLKLILSITARTYSEATEVEYLVFFCCLMYPCWKESLKKWLVLMLFCFEYQKLVIILQILCNGPGTCIPLCFAGFLLKVQIHKIHHFCWFCACLFCNTMKGRTNFPFLYGTRTTKCLKHSYKFLFFCNFAGPGC